jgi:hypothetical protein
MPSEYVEDLPPVEEVLLLAMHGVEVIKGEDYLFVSQEREQGGWEGDEHVGVTLDEATLRSLYLILKNRFEN